MDRSTDSELLIYDFTCPAGKQTRNGKRTVSFKHDLVTKTIIIHIIVRLFLFSRTVNLVICLYVNVVYYTQPISVDILSIHTYPYIKLDKSIYSLISCNSYHTMLHSLLIHVYLAVRYTWLLKIHLSLQIKFLSTGYDNTHTHWIDFILCLSLLEKHLISVLKYLLTYVHVLFRPLNWFVSYWLILNFSLRSLFFWQYKSLHYNKILLNLNLVFSHSVTYWFRPMNVSALELFRVYSYLLACNHLISLHIHFIAHSIFHVNIYTLPVIGKIYLIPTCTYTCPINYLPVRYTWLLKIHFSLQMNFLSTGFNNTPTLWVEFILHLSLLEKYLISAVKYLLTYVHILIRPLNWFLSYWLILNFSLRSLFYRQYKSLHYNKILLNLKLVFSHSVTYWFRPIHVFAFELFRLYSYSLARLLFIFVTLFICFLPVRLYYT